MASRSRLVGLMFLGLIVVGLLVAWVSTSIWVVQQNEQGVVVRFGRVARTMPPGIHFTLPWPMEELIAVDTSQIRSMPVGYKLSDVYNRLPPLAEEVEWLTGDTNIVELQATVQYTISDPAAYLFNVSDLSRASDLRDASTIRLGDEMVRVRGDERRFIIRKATEAVLTRLIAGMRVDDVLSTGKVELQSRAARDVQELLDLVDFGVSISSINIVEVNPPQLVIGAFQDVTSAKADKEGQITRGQGYAREVLPQKNARAFEAIQDAEIYRSERVNQGKGEAERFLKLAAEVAKNPELIRERLLYERIQRILSRAKIVVFSPPADGSKFRLYLEN